MSNYLDTMKAERQKFTVPQKLQVINQVDGAVAGGRNVKDVCQEMRISTASFYQWRKKYGDKARKNFETVTVDVPVAHHKAASIFIVTNKAGALELLNGGN